MLLIGIAYYVRLVCSVYASAHVVDIQYGSLRLYSNAAYSGVCLDEAPSERAKLSIREKCVSYLDRAEKLKKHLADPTGKNKKKPVADGSKSSGDG